MRGIEIYSSVSNKKTQNVSLKKHFRLRRRSGVSLKKHFGPASKDRVSIKKHFGKMVAPQESASEKYAGAAGAADERW